MKPDNDHANSNSSRWPPVRPYQDVEIDAPVRREPLKMSYHAKDKQEIKANEDKTQKVRQSTTLDFQLLAKINPELCKQVQLLQAINQPNSQKSPTRLSLGKIPLNYIGQAFHDNVSDQIDALQDSERLLAKARQYIQEIKMLKQIKSQSVSVQEIKQTMDMKTKKMTLIIERLKLIDANLEYQRKCEEKKEIKEAQKCNELSAKRHQKLQELKEIQRDNLKRDKLIHAEKQNIKQLQQQMRHDRFQRAIIRLQFGEKAFYRYGGRLASTDYTRHDLYSEKGDIVRWEGGMEILDVLDLKVFLLALMVPMSMSVFENFSAQTSVYRVMFGEDEGVKESEKQDCWNLVVGTIHKNMLDKKVESAASCINNKTRKRVVFVGSQLVFEDVMFVLAKELEIFTTKMMAVSAVDFSMGEEKFEGTSFSLGKLSVDYVYNQQAVKLQVEVLYCGFEAMRMRDWVVLRTKTGHRDSVFCWMEVPKALQNQRMTEVQEMHKMLQKCVTDGFGVMQGKRQENATK